MHPSSIRYDRGGAERQVFDALARALPDAYDVIHHVPWVRRRTRGGGEDGETDFVLVHPTRGVLVLEVKGGLVNYDAASGLWTTRRTKADPPQSRRDPFQQVTDSTYHLRNWLRELPGWRREWGPFGHAVLFPHGLLRGGPLPQLDPRIVLNGPDMLDDATLRRRIEGAFDFWADGSRLDAAGANRVVSALAHDLEVRQPLGFAVSLSDREILRLSDRQYDVLRTLAGNRRVAVAGPAGSGKTLIAAEKAKRLASDGFQTLLACFNRPLADYLRGSLAGTGRLDVLSFHQLCRKLAGEARLRLPPEPWSERDWERMPGLLEPAAVAVGPRYDAMVVDEAQDFHDDWWLPLLTLLREPDAGVLYVFYDSNQAIYGTPGGLPEGLMSIPLWENWRNTKPVFDAVMRYYQGEAVECRGPEGPAVEWHRVEARDLKRELARVLHRLVREGGIGAREVVVLTPLALDRSSVRGRCGAFNLTPTPSGRDDVPLSTIHRFKGLDRKAVVVCEVSGRDGAAFRQLMYVACSRARSLLVVLESER
ncbi:MAG: NERD domain-containing protein [Candidatus Dormibacteraeota bacterium]|nr:NERD domain-containing protein [Candidatus Dormibacteraeota bacterium]